jgi:hypothetical protein
MNGWNRLFVVVAVCWTLVAPFWLTAGVNAPIEKAQSSCTDVAYNLYGSSSSTKIDMERYRSEVDKCIKTAIGQYVSIPKVLSAMIGQGDYQLGLIAWGFILIPLALLWIVGWGLGRTVSWVAAGFRR